MALTPIEQGLINNSRKLQWLMATDMDGTLTQAGKFTSKLLQSLEKLARTEIPVLIVTGRSAGWVSGLVTYLPVAGAIAENGGLFYSADCGEPIPLTAIPNIEEHRRQLARTYQHLQGEFPQLQESTDNRFRLTDWTFDNRDLSRTQLARLEALCASLGWGFTYSSVQCHIKLAAQDKAAGLMRVLQDYFPQYLPEQVLTVGDSPNDASLFDPERFPLSVGVANILDYVSEIPYQPAYVTQAREGEGFDELVAYLSQFSTIGKNPSFSQKPGF